MNTEVFFMKCKRCKKTLQSDFKFCPWCGSKSANQKYYRRPDGLYEKSIVYDGKRHIFRARTEKELEKKIFAYNPESEQTKSGMPFSAVVEEWEADAFEALAQGSIKAYKPRAERAVDYFGDEPITNIGLREINRYIAKFPKSWAYKTVKAYTSVLSLIFTYAAQNEYITNNPCQYIQISKNLKRTHRRAPTYEEIEIIKNSISAPGGLLAFFFLNTGVRRGEALALKWSDIDFENHIIHITKSLYHVNNAPHIKEPKTEAGKRDVLLTKGLETELLKIKGEKNEIVFNCDCEYYTQSRFDKLWKDYQTATGLAELTPHIARHGFATICFEANLNIKDVQEILGHAQYSTTSDIYTHLTQKHKTEALNKLNTYFENNY